jgi:hypothetical protein
VGGALARVHADYAFAGDESQTDSSRFEEHDHAAGFRSFGDHIGESEMALTLRQAQAWRPETVQAVVVNLKDKLTGLGETLDAAKAATNKAVGESAGTGEEARCDFVHRATKHGCAKHGQITELQQAIDEAGHHQIHRVTAELGRTRLRHSNDPLDGDRRERILSRAVPGKPGTDQGVRESGDRPPSD